jgi:hypothetical protein
MKMLDDHRSLVVVMLIEKGLIDREEKYPSKVIELLIVRRGSGRAE